MLLNSRISIFYFVRLIKFDIVIIFIYALLAGTLDHFSMFKNVSIPLSISAMVGTIVSLLLAFRTSQSYERWWEARVVWGAIVNDSRTIIRQLLQCLPKEEESLDFIQSFAKRQIIWCYALSESLRKVPFSAKVQQYLTEHNIQSTNVPNALLSIHAEEIARLSAAYKLDPIKEMQIDTTLGRLTDSMGRCERIKNTIFPRSYSLLIHFLIYVFLTIFPFGLDDGFLVSEILLSITIPLLFIAVERTSIIMQDPFENQPNDTPMTRISETIEMNLREMTRLDARAPEEQNFSYYIL